MRQAIIVTPYVKLKRLAIPICIVKPTAAIARIDAVTSPNPIDATSRDIALVRWAQARLRQHPTMVRRGLGL